MPDAVADHMTAARSSDSGSDSDPAAVVRSGRGQSVLAAAALLTVVVDQLTKWWATTSLDTPIDVFWTMRFRLVYNTGTAFSLGRSLGPFIAIFAVVIVIVLVRMGRTMVTARGVIALGLVAGGAVGNLIDRTFRAEDGPLSGAVIDFVDFGWWPVFNVADMGIVIGGALLLLNGFRDASTDAPRSDTADGNPTEETPS